MFGQQLIVLSTLNLVLDESALTWDGAERRAGLFARPVAGGSKILTAHQRQGSLDGACGPYSVAMALAMHGMDVDAKRFIARLSRCVAAARVGALVPGGTTGSHLSEIVQRLAPRWQLQDLQDPNTAEGLRNTASAIDMGNPVIVGVEQGAGANRWGHWSVAVGYQGEQKSPARVFLLDPSGPRPQVTFWNAILERQNLNGPVRYRYAWLDEGLQVLDGVRVFAGHWLVSARGKAVKPPRRP